MNTTKTPLKTVRQWLKVIAGSKADSSYVNGIKLFMNEWEHKTPKAIKKLCMQIKEVVESDEAFALDVFGKAPTEFFKGLDVDGINYRK